MKKAKISFLVLLGAVLYFVFAQFTPGETPAATDQAEAASGYEYMDISQPYVAVGDGMPGFSEEDLTTDPFEYYSGLDSLGRCGVAYANICEELMPTEERGEIGSIKPSGWHTVKYEGIDGNYLYNRCHLIGFQLAGENANKHNLITGTRYLNVEGILPFENQIADYIHENPGHHVLYRVTPDFQDDELVCRGVYLEARSVEDDGCVFYVYCYNIQPGIEINYATGESKRIDE